VLLAIYGLFGFCVLPFGYFVLLYDPDWFSALFSSLCKEKKKKDFFCSILLPGNLMFQHE